MKSLKVDCGLWHGHSARVSERASLHTVRHAQLHLARGCLASSARSRDGRVVARLHDVRVPGRPTAIRRTRPSIRVDSRARETSRVHDATAYLTGGARSSPRLVTKRPEQTHPANRRAHTSVHDQIGCGLGCHTACVGGSSWSGRRRS